MINNLHSTGMKDRYDYLERCYEFKDDFYSIGLHVRKERPPLTYLAISNRRSWTAASHCVIVNIYVKNDKQKLGLKT